MVLFTVNGEESYFIPTSTWWNGTTMNDSLVDGTIYLKVNSSYYKRYYKGSLDVRWFGVKGDGITDDTVTINNAVNIALNLNKNLFFPTGTYLVNQPYVSINGSGSTTRSINFDKSGVKKIKIYGEAGTKITTSRTTGSIFYFYFKCIDCVIDNIFFENTHTITTTQNSAIYLQGLGSNQIKNFKITNCRFEGFSTSIIAQGVKGLTIESNVFEAPLGHDNAQDNDQPAVYIWLFDNTNGQCYDVRIINNNANGFTGTDITTTVTKRPMDGFVFGTAYGIIYENNVTRNFGQEHFLITPQTINPNLNYPVRIANNQFYLSIPTNSMWNNNPLISNYGVRADCNNVTIIDNDFFDYSMGVLIYPLNYPTLKGFGYKISDNRFYSPNNEISKVTSAIKVQGVPNSIDKKAANIIISDNMIQIKDIKLKSNMAVIAIYDSENIRIFNNTIFNQSINLDSYTFYGILYDRVLKLTEQNNIVL